MLDELKALNTAIDSACAENKSLNGCTFYKSSLEKFEEFPAVGTSLMAIKTLPTASGTVLIMESKVVIFVGDLIENHSDIITLYDEVLKKIEIIFGLGKFRTDDVVEFIDTHFMGSKKGVIAAVQIEI